MSVNKSSTLPKPSYFMQYANPVKRSASSTVDEQKKEKKERLRFFILSMGWGGRGRLGFIPTKMHDCNGKMCCAKSLQSFLFAIPWTILCPPGSSVRGILQARILAWVAIPTFLISCTGRRVLYHQGNLGSPLKGQGKLNKILLSANHIYKFNTPEFELKNKIIIQSCDTL